MNTIHPTQGIQLPRAQAGASEEAERSRKVGAGVQSSGSGALASAGQPSRLTLAETVPVPQLPADLGAAASRLNDVLAKLQDPNANPEALMKEFLGALGSSDDLASLMIKFAQMGRDDALDQRLSARDQAKSNLEAQADKTREAAVKELVSAVVSFAISVVSAVVSVAGAAKSAKSGAEAAEHLKDAKSADLTTKTGRLEANLSQKQADVALQSGQQANVQAQVAQQLGGATDKVVSTALNTSAKMDQAEGQEKAAEATVDQSKGDMSKKVMDDFEEMIKSAIQFLKEMQRAEVDLMANMTRV